MSPAYSTTGGGSALIGPLGWSRICAKGPLWWWTALQVTGGAPVLVHRGAPRCSLALLRRADRRTGRARSRTARTPTGGTTGRGRHVHLGLSRLSGLLRPRSLLR